MSGHTRRFEETHENDQEQIKTFQQYLETYKQTEWNEFSPASWDLTNHILRMDPDFYSVWNKRRILIRNTLKSRTIPDQLELLESELRFCEQLLKIQPKSYWIWHHRKWLLQHHIQPNWIREFGLLEKMLEFDTRNFHGWDYRRYLVQLSKEKTPMQEFDFSTVKIHDNFSNFSAWHHRSTVFEKAFHGEEYTEQILRGISLNYSSKDLDLVRNAIYTEPNDQSAWLYQRWLLEKGFPKKVQLLNVLIKYKSQESCYLVCVFNQKIEPDKIQLEYRIEENEWKQALLSPSKVTSHIFTSLIECSTNESISINVKGLVNIHLSFQKTNADAIVYTSTDRGLSLPLDVLEKEIYSVKELLELEPESKWTMLAYLYLLKTRHEHYPQKMPINSYHEESKKIYGELIKVDALRKNFYQDQLSLLQWEHILSKSEGLEIDASHQGLSFISTHILIRYPQSILAQRLNISGNPLKSLPHDLEIYFPFLNEIQR